MSVTVITSTIGRPELRQCIESVMAQTYRCRHHVYVNGPRFHEQARLILDDYPEVHAVYLPEDTGDYGLGGSMVDVFAAASHLASSDWVVFLDDDNFFDPNHVESLVKFATENELKWAYSLRRYVDKNGANICDDDWCSLGHWPIMGTNTHLVDNSCYFVDRKLACRMGLAWTAVLVVADRAFCMALMASGERYGCTGLSTVNYRIGTGTAQEPPELYRTIAARVRSEMPAGFPWRKPTVLGQPIQP